MIRFCPACGEPVDPPVLPPRHFECARCGHPVWCNPKPCSGALVIRGGKAMLSRRAIEPELGKWDVPGGFCEPNEHPEETARRELREETGLEIALTGLLGVFMDVYGDSGQPTLNFCYLATIADDAEPVPADDIDAIGWFAAEALPPPGELAFAHTVPILEAWQSRGPA